MSKTATDRSHAFLQISDQFQLGALTTEASHPITVNLSEVAQRDVASALGLLFEVDGDVVRKYAEFAATDQAASMSAAVMRALRNGGRIFFTGCGSTGRLSIQLVSIWRDFWQRQAATGARCSPAPSELEGRAFAVMAGGDYALIKSVEGFEDFTAFGAKQIADLGVCERDVVFAITEGGETSFVIGTAWKGVEASAKVYFVYNNPDDVLCRHVQRSREIIDDSRIEKVNLTTGPMAITGSTRMQATSIQLAVLSTVLEMVVRELLGKPPIEPSDFLRGLTELHRNLKSPQFLAQLARLTTLEADTYRSGHKTSYFADHLGIDVLTDTTERSPTYCTPPFRKFDDPAATESWAFLFVPAVATPTAWEHILKRPPRCVEWTEQAVRELAGEEKAARTYEIVRRITSAELMRFRVGLDGRQFRPLSKGDTAIGIVSEAERASLLSPDGFHRTQLEAAHDAGASTGLIYIARAEFLDETSRFLTEWDSECAGVLVPVPDTGLLLDGVTRAGVKLALNALSTCTMVRLGRVMGNYMIWVVASNLKLIDRATRYIQKLTGLPYRAANQLLFEVIEYVEPRMKADRAYPPVVGLAVTRARHGVGNEEAEKRFLHTAP